MQIWERAAKEWGKERVEDEDGVKEAQTGNARSSTRGAFNTSADFHKESTVFSSLRNEVMRKGWMGWRADRR